MIMIFVENLKFPRKLTYTGDNILIHFIFIQYHVVDVVIIYVHKPIIKQNVVL